MCSNGDLGKSWVHLYVIEHEIIQFFDIQIYRMVLQQSPICTEHCLAAISLNISLLISPHAVIHILISMQQNKQPKVICKEIDLK